MSVLDSLTSHFDRFWQYLQRHKIFGPVATAIIATVLLGMWQPALFKSLLLRAFESVVSVGSSSYTIQGGLILAAIALMLPAGVFALIRSHRKNKHISAIKTELQTTKGELQTIKDTELQKPDYLEYKSDAFYEVPFTWDWWESPMGSSDLKYFPKLHPRIICPDCEGRAEYGNDNIYAYCKGCGWHVGMRSDDDPFSIEVRELVLGKIEAKARNGKWNKHNQ